MRARHLISTHSGNVKSPREKPRTGGSLLQMKHCNDNVVARMAETPLFANLPLAERDELKTALNVRVHAYNKGELITHECEAAADVMVVLKGRVTVHVCGLREDRRYLIQRLVVGDTYGASFPVLDFSCSPAMLTADKPTEILYCKVGKIRQLLKTGTHPSFITNLYAASARQGFASWRKLILLSCYEISDRVKHYLRWREEDGLAHAPLPSVAELAEHLGVNRTALYRALKNVRSVMGKPCP